MARVAPVAGMAELAPAGLVIEAVVEDPGVKRDVLRALGPIVAETAVIGTNTSSLSVTDLSQAVGRPERFLGVHFFNPPTRLALVDLVPTARTAPETLARVRELLASCEKTPVVVKDRPGFIVNRLLLLLINEAARMVDEGVASAEDIDTAMQLGALHPAGPLTVADLIGLDTCQKILTVLHEKLEGSSYAPAGSIRDRVTSGKLGRKTGEGFYPHGHGEAHP